MAAEWVDALVPNWLQHILMGFGVLFIGVLIPVFLCHQEPGPVQLAVIIKLDENWAGNWTVFEMVDTKRRCSVYGDWGIAGDTLGIRPSEISDWLDD